jgi:F-type H+-transporting ATPase subunit delta
LEVAAQESDVERVARDVSAVVAAVSGHDDLRRVLTGAAIPVAARVGVARALVGRLDVAAPVASLVVLLAQRGRLALLDEIAAVYHERLLAYKNIVPAQVRAAVPLPAEQAAALEASLSRVTGKHVRLQLDVDLSLIGGVVARIGSTVYDGSIRTQLETLKRQLMERAS